MRFAAVSVATDGGTDGRMGARTPQLADTTIDLIEQVKRGENGALDAVLKRQMPILQRWAHGRLPYSNRAVMDTCDLVQDTMISALRHVEAIELRRRGALQAYLRHAVMNRVRDLVRRDRCRPARAEMPLDVVDDSPSALEQLIGSENVGRYEAAVQTLPERDRKAIIGRLELHYTYDELAVALDAPSANAARAAVSRAMKRLVEAICLHD